MNLHEVRISRRVVVSAIGAGVLLTACEGKSPSFKSPTETPTPKEDEAPVKTGDLLIAQGKKFVVVNKKRYEVGESYEYNSKFNEYGGKIHTAQPADIFPVGTVKSGPFIDMYTGGIKERREKGGEINIYIAGFTTDSSQVYDVLKPEEDTFINIRDDLEKNRFRHTDSYFYTYGQKGISQYEAKNTAQNPDISFKQAYDQIEELLEQNPLVRINIFGHSLGGVIGLNLARKYEGLVNNLFLIAAPVRGLDDGGLNAVKIRAYKATVRAYLGLDDEVIDYLTALWNNKDYQKDIDDFSERFTKRGGKITEIANKEDGIVPEKSVGLKASDKIVISMGKEDGDALGLSGHGRPVWNEKGRVVIKEKVGVNRAA